MNPLSIFPRLRYIGGIVGHSLDLHLGEHKARYVRLSLKGHAALNLERVVLYGYQGETNSSRTVVNLSSLATASQSSTLTHPNESDQEARQKRGAHIGNNGISNGYNYFSTAIESNPWWQMDLGSVYELKTLHINNFCSGELAYAADNLVISISQDQLDWSTVYDRNAQAILMKKYEKAVTAIQRGANLTPKSSRQRAAQRKLSSVASSLISLITTAPGDHTTLASYASNVLLDFVDLFLPTSLETSGRDYVFHDIIGVNKIRVNYPNCAQHPPDFFEISYYDGSSVVIPHALELNHDPRKAIAQLKIHWSPGTYVHYANSMSVQILTDEDTLTAGDIRGWITLHDNSAAVDICSEIAWTAFLMGNSTARCFGLIAKCKIMPRRNDSSIREAYYFCRLNMHGKNKQFKAEVASIANSATANDFSETRLSFSRHSFTTLLCNRNQNDYALAIRLAMEMLASLGLRSFLLYGTLLGAVRDNGFIPHDDDVDVGYISKFQTLDELKEERNFILRSFAQRGWSAHNLEGHVHLSYTVIVPVGNNKYEVELFPIWNTQPSSDRFMAYMEKMEIRSIPAEVIGDSNSVVRINGLEFGAPAKPEEFLSLRYGENWRTPDPYFEI